MNYDFMAVLDVFGRFLLIAMILRYILTLFPENLRKVFEEPALQVRYNIISVVETLWPDKDSFEVVFLSRIAAPFVLLTFVSSYLFYDGMFLAFIDDYQYIKLIIFVVNIFIFINVAPTPDDFKMLWDTAPNTKFLFLLKLAIVLTFISNWSSYLLIAILITPIFTNESIKEIDNTW